MRKEIFGIGICGVGLTVQTSECKLMLEERRKTRQGWSLIHCTARAKLTKDLFSSGSVEIICCRGGRADVNCQKNGADY